MTTTFRELCNNKPSVAVQAMYRGLIVQDKREDFIVNMDTFFYTCAGICFGCAATCAIQELLAYNLTSEDEGWDAVLSAGGVDRCDLLAFEHVLDLVRLGNFVALGRYFDCDLRDWQNRICLTNENYLRFLPELKQISEEIEEKGL